MKVMRMIQEIEKIRDALKALGYPSPKFIAAAIGLGRYEVQLDGEYFGVWDSDRQTFAD